MNLLTASIAVGEWFPNS